MTDLCSLTPPADYRPPRGILGARETVFQHVVPTYLPLPVANTAGDRITPVGLVLHVQAGNGSPYGWFNNLASQASSTFWAGKRGQREQYGDYDERMWAQADGNETYASIETEGYPDEPLTDAQLDSVAVAYAEGVRLWSWPLQVANAPGQPGLGTHAMGGSDWGGHTGCPGTIRTGQRAEILRRAGAILNPPPEDDVTPDDIKAIATAVWAAGPPAITPTVRQATMRDVGAQTYNKAGDLQARVSAIARAIASMVDSSHPATAILAAAAADPPADEVPLTDLVAGMSDPRELALVISVASSRLRDLATPATT
jgi:hypothetical protein